MLPPPGELMSKHVEVTVIQRPLAPALIALLASAGCTEADVWFLCSDGEPICEERLPATGVDIGGIALFQGVENWIMENGNEVEPALPVAAGRDAMVRVMLEPSESFTPREIVGRLYVLDDSGFAGGLEASIDLTGPSTEESLESSLNFTVPGDLISSSSRFLIKLLEAVPGAEGPETEGVNSWPEDNEDGFALPVSERADTLRLYIIPVQYDADGSGRLPDLTDEQIEIYRSLMWAVYPTSSVEIEIGDPFPWSSVVSANGSGWDGLLNAVGEARSDLGVAQDQYIYGLFNPSDNMGQFCGGGCVVGLSNLAFSSGDAFNRASIGVGFPGQDSAWTMVHEVGHAHGRNHAPCGGAAGPDPEFPYDDGGVGVRGYDMAAGQLKEAAEYKDFMGYCSPNWLADYTFDQLYQRIEGVNDLVAPSGTVAERVGPPVIWASSYLSMDGALHWSDKDLVLHHVPGGEPVDVELFNAAGERITTVEGRFTPYGDLPGGRYVFPVHDLPVASITVDGARSPLRALPR
jgi:hypothetical protein